MTAAQRAAHVLALEAGRPVVWPHPGHDEGECDYCDELRELYRIWVDEQPCAGCGLAQTEAKGIYLRPGGWACETCGAGLETT